MVGIIANDTYTTKVVNEDGAETEYTYDALNRLSGTDYNGTRQANCLYNKTGQLVEMTDWNGTMAWKDAKDGNGTPALSCIEEMGGLGLCGVLGGLYR